MDALGKMLHLRGRVYEARFRGEVAYILPLIERIGERSFAARVEAVFANEAMDWVEANRSELRAGVTLSNVDLRDIHARGDVMHCVVVTPPTIAPPRQQGAPSPTPTTQAASA